MAWNRPLKMQNNPDHVTDYPTNLFSSLTNLRSRLERQLVHVSDPNLVTSPAQIYSRLRHAFSANAQAEAEQDQTNERKCCSRPILLGTSTINKKKIAQTIKNRSQQKHGIRCQINANMEAKSMPTTHPKSMP